MEEGHIDFIELAGVQEGVLLACQFNQDQGRLPRLNFLAVHEALCSQSFLEMLEELTDLFRGILLAVVFTG